MKPQYTLVESVSTSIPTSPRRILGGAKWPGPDATLPPLVCVGARNLGEIVTDRTSSWVRRVPHASGDFYVKTYDFPTWAIRAASVLRRPAALLHSRAEREFEALQWLRGHGFAAPEPIAAVTWRQAGLVRRAILVTRAHPGQRVDRLLAQLPEDAQRSLVVALARFVVALHAAGFRDRNLDLRNLLAVERDDGWQIAKLDSPRYRLRRPGSADDRLARADWQRLLPQLPGPLADTARAAAHESRQRNASTDA